MTPWTGLTTMNKDLIDSSSVPGRRISHQGRVSQAEAGSVFVWTLTKDCHEAEWLGGE
jgi:hypothetical protein